VKVLFMEKPWGLCLSPAGKVSETLSAIVGAL